uniref:Pepsin inhibitor-3-like repeated domain-containing protein n=1 Tax=Ditylenchus dipsaci TaxID=166011 RepID=A0A915DGL9_9BILA
MLVLLHILVFIYLICKQCCGEIEKLDQQNVDISMRPDTVSSYEEFSVNNGKCMYKNGNVIEEGVTRPATEDEIRKLHLFKNKLAEYGAVLQQHMTQYLAEMVKQNRTREHQADTHDWPMAPQHLAFARNASIKLYNYNSGDCR